MPGTHKITSNTYKKLLYSSEKITGKQDPEIIADFPICDSPEAVNYTVLSSMLLDIKVNEVKIKKQKEIKKENFNGFKITPKIFLYHKGDSLEWWKRKLRDLPISEENVVIVDEMRQTRL